MGKHRAEVRPRYGRIAVLGSSLAVTFVAVLGGIGVLPSTAGDVAGAAVDQASGSTPVAGDTPDDAASSAPDTSRTDDSADSASPSAVQPGDVDPTSKVLADAVLPVDSGEGKRVVFSESRQRVWLVDDESEVVSTYLVSGSTYDNLDPGTFEVYSRSEDATGIDDSGTMKYFVRFTTGDSGSAIGFHDIPIKDGEPLQTVAQLGTPLSHGCIRQRRSDAIALWDFAPIGTTVVVTA